ncbi:hypothetical protein EVAR_37534_1 [Eumeta japonica]|uniref:Uncharacterized protein n=1 Tax=Eumeta variegata TaxID=151549 RepID=A0A4C1XST1_EUMVA|nr:hypothetical protein EVAR_37534_1 [Eumeta japonica]
MKLDAARNNTLSGVYAICDGGAPGRARAATIDGFEVLKGDVGIVLVRNVYSSFAPSIVRASSESCYDQNFKSHMNSGNEDLTMHKSLHVREVQQTLSNKRCGRDGGRRGNDKSRRVILNMEYASFLQVTVAELRKILSA